MISVQYTRPELTQTLARIAQNRMHVGSENDACGCRHIGRCAFCGDIARELIVRRHHGIEEEQKFYLTVRLPKLLRDLQNNQTAQGVPRKPIRALRLNAPYLGNLSAGQISNCIGLDETDAMRPLRKAIKRAAELPRNFVRQLEPHSAKKYGATIPHLQHRMND